MNSFSLKEELKEESLKMCDAIQLKKSPIFADELVSSQGMNYMIYSTKRFVFKFQGESLELFLSYHAHFRRYEHFRGFWQSIGSSFRSC